MYISPPSGSAICEIINVQKENDMQLCCICHYKNTNFNKFSLSSISRYKQRFLVYHSRYLKFSDLKGVATTKNRLKIIINAVILDALLLYIQKHKGSTSTVVHCIRVEEN